MVTCVDISHNEKHQDNSNSTLCVTVLGTGKIGNRVIAKLQEGASSWRKFGVTIQLVAYANRKNVWRLQESTIEGSYVSRAINSCDPIEFGSLLAELRDTYKSAHVVVDCTACDKVARQYSMICQYGYHIVAANKRANVLPYQEVKEMHKHFRTWGRQFLYSTNVGAGLPILSTIRDLCRSGDNPYRTEAILSGTLGFIFSNLKENVQFSYVLDLAVRLGLTEPDVREDLSGFDVARKALIIAREMGISANIEDVELESFASLDKTLDLSSLDQHFARLTKTLDKKGLVLRYVANISSERIRVQLMELPKHSVLGFCSHTDNVALIYTKNYSERPLVIQGGGAGVEVTATAVVSDILKLVSMTAHH